MSPIAADQPDSTPIGLASNVCVPAVSAPVFRLGELAARFGLELRGDPAREVRGANTLAAAGAAELSFLANPHYRPQLPATSAHRSPPDKRPPTDTTTAHDPWDEGRLDPRPAPWRLPRFDEDARGVAVEAIVDDIVHQLDLVAQ